MLNMSLKISSYDYAIAAIVVGTIQTTMHREVWKVWDVNVWYCTHRGNKYNSIQQQ